MCFASLSLFPIPHSQPITSRLVDATGYKAPVILSHNKHECQSVFPSPSTADTSSSKSELLHDSMRRLNLNATPKLGGSSASGSSSQQQGGQGHAQNVKKKDIAIGGLTTALEVAKNASVCPPLQTAAGGVLAIMDVIEKESSNAHDIDALAEKMGKLNLMIERSIPNDYESRPEALKTRLEGLQSGVDAICKNIGNLRHGGRVSRTLTAKATSGKIQEHLRELTSLIETFILGGIIDIQTEAGKLQTGLNDVRQQLQDQERRAELRNRFWSLSRAKNARFDYNSHRVCEKETRLETLASIYHWIKPGDPRLKDLTTDLVQQPTERQVLWLYGPAGTGKSTIAQTVAEWCHGANHLGASFFCSRDSDECSNVRLIFPTIAYQLGVYSLSFQNQVADVLYADPDIQNTGVSHQLQKLIAEPLRAAKSSGAFPPCAVIVDALDECKDDQATSVVLEALAQYAHDLNPLKFFITSRPVDHITGGFSMTGLKDITQHFSMISIPSESTTRDIKQYLQKQMEHVAHRYKINGSWPSDHEMAALVHQASGLFIFAATAVRFIHDSQRSNPKRQLKKLLDSRPSTSSTSLYRSLDALYTEILKTAFPDIGIDRELRTEVNMIMGSVVLVRDPLPSSSLDDLLGLESGTVRRILLQLQSLVIVPEHDNDPIRLIHPSIPDFLTNGSRCEDPNFVVDPVIQHSILAQQCLWTLQNLRKDICGIGDPSKLNAEVPDLESRVAEHISLHLQYACKHWMFHIANAKISKAIYELLEVFVAEHLLHWLEALSLLGDIGSAIEGLPVARKALEGLPLPASDISSMLYDCEQIARHFYPSLSVSCLQVYFGVIPFCPTDTGLRKRYENKVSNVATVLNGSQHTWSPCIRIMEGHSNMATAVAFSPSGEQIVSCSDDETVRLWDVKTGSHLQTLCGHDRCVFGVAFSPSGHKIVSCSQKEIIIWDSVTGDLLDKVKTEEDSDSSEDEGYINSSETEESFELTRAAIAWSPKGHFLGLSPEGSGSVIIWDMTRETLQFEQPLFFFEHHSGTPSFVFSHDDSFIISCHADGKCIVRNLQNGSLIPSRTLTYKNAACSVALSHDDKTVACCYWDADIVLWDMGDGRCIHKLTGHTGRIYSIDFSSDDQTLATGSVDTTIRLWSVSSGAQLVTLIGHLHTVFSARFSPDGNLICSGSCDNTVRLWNWKNTVPAMHQTHLTGNDHHLSTVHVMAISGDNTVLATGSLDGTIYLWDTSTGTRVQALSDYREHIYCLALSPSGNQLSVAGVHKDEDCEDSSATVDRILVWNVKTSQPVQVFESVNSTSTRRITYAHDEHTVLSGSFDGSLLLWDTMAAKAHFSGEILYQSDGNITDISVSPNKQLVLFACDLFRPGGIHIRLLDMTMKVVLWTRELPHSTSISSLSFSSDGSRMLSESGHGHIFLWDTSLALSPGGNDAMLEEFYGGGIYSPISFSPDQKSIVSSTSFHPIAAKEHWPHCASVYDEKSPETAPVYFHSEGWIWRAASGEKKRICWVPPEYRHVVENGQGNPTNTRVAAFASMFVFGMPDGRVVLIDLSNCARIAELS